jgi:DHA2 family multidrug resistance protein
MYNQLQGMGMTEQQASGWIAQQITNQGLIISPTRFSGYRRDLYRPAGAGVVCQTAVWRGGGGGGGGALPTPCPERDSDCQFR